MLNKQTPRRLGTKAVGLCLRLTAAPESDSEARAPLLATTRHILSFPLIVPVTRITTMTTTPPLSDTDKPRVTLRLAAHPKRAGHTDYPVQLGPDATITDVKEVVAKWDGQPKAEGVLVIVGGRILKDEEKVSEVLPGGVSPRAQVGETAGADCRS